MFRQLSKYFGSQKNATRYKPIKHVFFKDPKVAEQLHENGYCVVDFIGEKEITLLSELYAKHHKIEDSQGGIFISTFSKNIAYRKRIWESVNAILENSFNKWFQNYKSNVNTFAVKTPGKLSHFIMHQDVAAIDEEKFSLLNIWIPLQDITPNNGALCIVPRSHNIFSPFRCPTVPPILKNIDKELYRYAIPIYLNAGQAIFFDPRVFHFSGQNSSNQSRVVVQCRICPSESKAIVYFNSQRENEMQVEMWQCPDDYFVTGNAYTENIRPEGCKLIGNRTNLGPLTVEEFEERIKEHEIIIQDNFIPVTESQRDFIREPISENLN